MDDKYLPIPIADLTIQLCSDFYLSAERCRELTVQALHVAALALQDMNTMHVCPSIFKVENLALDSW